MACGGIQHRPVERVDGKAPQAAAVYENGGYQLSPQRMVAAEDAEIAANIGKHFADGLAADQGCELLGG